MHTSSVADQLWHSVFSSMRTSFIPFLRTPISIRALFARPSYTTYFFQPAQAKPCAACCMHSIHIITMADTSWSLPDPQTTTIRCRKDCRSLRRRDGLIKYASNNTSQNGEDGVIKRLFELLPCSKKRRYCVDVGAWDGVHLSNTYSLLAGTDGNKVDDRKQWKLLPIMRTMSMGSGRMAVGVIVVRKCK